MPSDFEQAILFSAEGWWPNRLGSLSGDWKELIQVYEGVPGPKVEHHRPKSPACSRLPLYPSLEAVESLFEHCSSH